MMKSNIDMGYVRTVMGKMKQGLKLATHWQNRMSEYLGQGVPSLTGQQVGQIKSLFFKTDLACAKRMHYERAPVLQ